MSRPRMRDGARLVVVSSCLAIMTACAAYDRGQALSLARANKNAAALQEGMCSDFDKASHALQTGPDKAWPLVGKASEMKDLAEQASKKAAQCREVRTRGASTQDAALVSFKEWWTKAEPIIAK